MSDLLKAIVILVPLLGGIGLVFVCAQAIARNPNMSNSYAYVLGIAALLCVAPTLASLTLKLPGGVELSALQQQIEQQNAQIKGNLGEQGADIKRELRELRQRVDSLQRNVSPSASAAAPPAEPAKPPNREGVVVIFYAQPRRDLAQKIEDELLRQGYSANAVYTDFSEIAASTRGPEGTATLVYTQQKQALADEIKQVLKSKFADAGRLADQIAPKLSGADVQVRLF